MVGSARLPRKLPRRAGSGSEPGGLPRVRVAGMARQTSWGAVFALGIAWSALEPARAWGRCLTGPFADPLLGTTQPMVLVLHVDPSLRHRGVARELIAHADGLLYARGHATLAARAGHNDDALISMGERWGFVRSWELMVRE